MRASIVSARRRNKLLALAIAASPFALSSTASADKYWINSVTNSSWNNAANWNGTAATGAGGAGVPGSSDNVFLSNTLANTYTINLNQTGSGTISSMTIGDTATNGLDLLSYTSTFTLAITNNLNVGSVSGSTGSFSLSGNGSVTVNGAAYLGGSSSGSGGVGTLNVSSGTFEAGLLDIYTNGTLTQTSGTVAANTINQSGGHATVAAIAVDSAAAYLDTTSSGSYSLGGGTLTNTGAEFIGLAGVGTFTQNGGTQTIAGQLDLGAESGATGTYSLNSGSLTVSQSVYIGGSSTSAGGVGTLTVSSGGTLSVTDAVDLINGTFTQSGGLVKAGSATQSGGHATFSQLEIDPTPAITVGGVVQSYSLSGGTLTTPNEYVGYLGTGTFTQSGGTNSITGSFGELDIGGGGASGKGTYTLSGTGSISDAGNLDIAGSFGSALGSGTFTQSGGAVSVSGTAYIFPNGTLTQTGSGIFEFGSINQSGGTASFASELQVDTTLKSNTVGSYTLSSGSLSDSFENIGETSGGTFTQSGGFNTVSSILAIGDVAPGTYMLSGTGSLSAGTEYVGFGGAGTFNQNGGSNTVSALSVGLGTPGTYMLSGGTLTVGTAGSPQELDLGSGSSITGAFQLSGTGSATVNGSLYIGGTSSGQGGSATLSISGGTMAVTSGITLWSGDTLSQTAGLLNVGTITQNGGTATFSTLSIDSTATLTTGTTAKTYSMTGGTLTVANEFVGNKGTGTFSQPASTVTVTGDLDIGAVIGSTGTYTLATAGTLNVSGNLDIGGAGGVAGGSGTLTLSNGTISVTGTTYLFNNSTLHQTGSGIFEFGSVNQSGGTASFADDLYVDKTVGSYTAGSYTLSSGSLSDSVEHIGETSGGTFTQSGGLNTVSEDLFVGDGASGTYMLSGTGSLSAGTEYVGNSTGTFNQSGGSNTVSTLLDVGFHTGTYNQSGGTCTIGTAGSPKELDIGISSGSTGTYLLSGTGSATINGSAYVGGSSSGAGGAGTLSISGGTMAVTSGITLWSGDTLSQTAGLLNVGTITQNGGTGTFTTLSIDSTATLTTGTTVKTYSMSGGTLTVGNEFVGNKGTGTFSQPASTVTVTADLDIGAVGGSMGTYTLATAGTLNVSGNLDIGGAGGVAGGSGTFTQSNGSASVYGSTFLLPNGTLNQTSGLFDTNIFNQSGGHATVTGLLVDSLAYSTTGTTANSYTLSGGTLTNDGSEVIGHQGTGSFSQTGGAHTIADDLDIGALSGGVGTYTLSGAGTLTISGNLDIGGAGGVAGGSGTFTQSNGTAFAYGSTFLFPNGTLNQTSGFFDTGTFNQSGGHATVTGLLLDTTGYYTDGTNAHSYTLSGGTLTVSGYEDLGYQSTVTFTQTGGTATVANDLDIADQNTATATYNLSGTGSLSVSGSVFVGGSSGGQGGTGTLAISGGTMTVTNGVTLWSGDTLSQTAGLLNVGTITQNGGTATFSALSIGSTATLSTGTTAKTLAQSAGMFTAASVNQSGGTASFVNLDIDTSLSSISSTLYMDVVGSYTLGGGSLQITHTGATGSELIGTSSGGLFTQTGGSNTMIGLTVGFSAPGTYTLSAGSLAASGQVVFGYTGAGTFTQSGGSVTIGTSGSPGEVDLGFSSGAGTYSLSGTGSATVNGSVYLGGNSSGSEGTGNLSVSGGQFTTTGALDIYTHGTLSQTAGSLTVMGGLTDSGTATFSGGTFAPTTIDGTGSMTVNNSDSLTATHVRQGTLTVASSSMVTITANGTSTATSILTNLSNSGTLNLKNNDLILTNGSNVGSQIAAAYHAGAWNQAGISSSSALAHTAYNLGYAVVGSSAGSLNISSFDGQPVSSGTTVVKYTLNGDMNLDTSVDQSDIALLAPHYGTTSGATWYQGDVNHDGAVDQNDIALIAPNYGQSANAAGNALTPTLTPGIKTALTRSASPNFSSSGLSGGVSPALNHLYTWDAALPDATAGNVIIKVDNTTGDSHFGDVILQGNSATLYTLVITSASGSMNSGRYDSLNAQYNGGGASEAATLQGLAVDNTTNHSGNFSVFSQTANKINEAGLGVTLDFTSNAESLDISTKANNKNLFSGITEDLAFSWSGQNGTLVAGQVEYTYIPEPGMLGTLGVGGVMMMRRRKASRSTQST